MRGLEDEGNQEQSTPRESSNRTARPREGRGESSQTNHHRATRQATSVDWTYYQQGRGPRSERRSSWGRRITPERSSRHLTPPGHGDPSTRTPRTRRSTTEHISSEVGAMDLRGTRSVSRIPNSHKSAFRRPIHTRIGSEGFTRDGFTEDARNILDRKRGKQPTKEEQARSTRGLPPISPAKQIRFPSTTPFCQEIVAEPAGKVKLPSSLKYDGSTDPNDHLDLYQGHMTLEAHTDATWCKYFPTTLVGVAQSWFQSLPPGSVLGYDDLAEKFKSHYVTSARHKRSAAELMTVRQDKDESLREYLARFTQEALTIISPDPTLSMLAFRQGLHDGVIESKALKYDIDWEQQKNMGDVRTLAQKYISNEDFRKIASASNPKNQKGEEKDGQKSKKQEARKRPDLQPPYESYTPLTKPISEIYSLHKNDDKWQKPRRLKKAGRDLDAYCDFHGCPGHSTEKCRSLRDNLEDLIRRGYFKQYKDWEKQKADHQEDDSSSKRSEQGKAKTIRQIY